MPGMSGSGNMMPQSTRMMRPSTSIQAQLRPISPSPPRKTTRTGFAPPFAPPCAFLFSGKRRTGIDGRADRGQDLGGHGIELGGGCPHGQAALAHLETQGAEDGLGGQGVGVLLGRLEVKG